MGPANCIGKVLALKQMRYVIAMLVRNFVWELEAGYDPGQWEGQLLDRALLVKGKLPVRITARTT